MQLLGRREGMGGPSDEDSGGQRRTAPRPAQSSAGAGGKQPAPAKASSGFDDMDDDIPF